MIEKKGTYMIEKKAITPGVNNFLTFAESGTVPEQIMSDEEYKKSIPRLSGYPEGLPADNALMNTALRNLSLAIKGLTDVIAENGVDVPQTVTADVVRAGLIASITNMIDERVVEAITPHIDRMQKQIDTYANAYHGVPVKGILPISCSEAELKQFLLDYPAFHVCDGSDGTVNLQDRFILAASPGVPPHNMGGSKTVDRLEIGGTSLKEDQVPEHKHEVPGTDDAHLVDKWPFGAPPSAKTYLGTSHAEGMRVYSSPIGKGKKHIHEIKDTTKKADGTADGLMPPYYSLIFVQKMRPY